MTTDTTAGLDVAAYLARIGYTGSTEARVDTLHALVAAHNRSIPFENLDPLLGIPVVDLSASALADKLVQRRRGGYCYEQNGLMGYVLTALGFEVHRLAGRVVWMSTSEEMPAQTHETLSVRVHGDDGAWLVDVGFGGQTRAGTSTPMASSSCSRPTYLTSSSDISPTTSPGSWPTTT